MEINKEKKSKEGEKEEVSDSEISKYEFKNDIDKIEDNTELIVTFKPMNIPKQVENLPAISKHKAKFITNETNLIKDKDIIPEDSNLRKLYNELINRKEPEPLDIETQKKNIIKNETEHMKNIIPEGLIQYFEPYEIKHSITQKINIEKKKEFDTFKFIKRKIDYEQKKTPYTHTETDFVGVDFDLITKIQKKQRELTKKIKELDVNTEEEEEEKEKEEVKIKKTETKKKRLKSTIGRKKRLILEEVKLPKKKKDIYIPKTNKYKEINFRKERIFTDDFPKKKKRRNTSTVCSRAHTACASKPHTSNITKANTECVTNRENTEQSLNFNNEERIIQKRLNNLKNKLKYIKKVMTQDKNFSHRMIERIHIRKFAESHKEDEFVRKEVRKEKYFALYMENGGLKQQIAVNPFGKVKSILHTYNSKGGDPIKETLATTLHKFYKNEYIEMFMRNQTIKNNVQLRLKKNKIQNAKLKKKILICEKNDDKIKYLERMMKKELQDTEDMIENFKRK